VPCGWNVRSVGLVKSREPFDSDQRHRFGSGMRLPQNPSISDLVGYYLGFMIPKHWASTGERKSRREIITGGKKMFMPGWKKKKQEARVGRARFAKRSTLQNLTESAEISRNARKASDHLDLLRRPCKLATTQKQSFRLQPALMDPVGAPTGSEMTPDR